MWEPAAARVATRLATALPQVGVVALRDDGSLVRWAGPASGGAVPGGGTPLTEADVRVEAAYASHDLYAGGPVRAFMIHLLKSPTVRWLQSSAAGFDPPVFAKLAAKGIRLSNTNANAIAVAEFALARVLDEFHPNRARRELQARGEWRRLTFREVAGTTWLVVGLGNIGGEVARRAQAFGAHVIGVRRRPAGGEPVAELVAPEGLSGALPRADVVVLTLPATPETLRLTDARFLAALKPGALLVNVGRGSLIDEPALLAALERGTPACAILDVFEREPLPPGHPFWSHPRVRLSAHSAADTAGTVARCDAQFLDNLERYVAGQPLRFEVEPALILGQR